MMLKTYIFSSYKKEKSVSFQQQNYRDNFVAATKNSGAANYLSMQMQLALLLLWQNIFVVPFSSNDFVDVTKPFSPG